MAQEKEIKTILVTRFSSMSDVALLVPVLHSLKRNYPTIRIILLTTRGFDAMFDNLRGIKIVHYHRRNKHKGIIGFFRLYSKLRYYNIDAVAELQGTLRMKVLSYMFKLFSKTKVAHLDAGKQEKEALIKKGYKAYSRPLTHITERYKNTFRKLGFIFDVRFKTILSENEIVPLQMEQIINKKQSNDIWVGVAPFARHKAKIYSLKLMEKVVGMLSENGITVVLFGHGSREKQIFFSWKEKYPSIQILPSETYLPEELLLMSYMDVMVSMDSANMHCASLVNVPVVSVWGGTHPYIGHLGFNQKLENAVGLDLDCRPCSENGERHCPKGTYECVKNLEPECIVNQVLKVIDKIKNNK